jgi:hypothetical protein
VLLQLQRAPSLNAAGGCFCSSNCCASLESWTGSLVSKERWKQPRNLSRMVVVGSVGGPRSKKLAVLPRRLVGSAEPRTLSALWGLDDKNVKRRVQFRNGSHQARTSDEVAEGVPYSKLGCAWVADVAQKWLSMAGFLRVNLLKNAYFAGFGFFAQ